SGGLQTTTYVDIRPQLSTFTLNTSFSGLGLNLDGQPQNVPANIVGVVGMQRTLDATTLQTVNGLTYRYVSWSDGGAATHTILTPAVDTNYTANYQALALAASYSSNPPVAWI